LNLYDTFFYYPSFLPSFSGVGYVLIDIPPGETDINIIPDFVWPDGCGEYESARFITTVTDESLSRIIGHYDVFEFGWSQ